MGCIMDFARLTICLPCTGF